MTLPIVQLFEPQSCTYTYIVYDSITLEAAIIDPVDLTLHRDLEALNGLGLQLKYVIETHTHADHITSAAALLEHTGAQAATPAGCGAPAAILLHDNDCLTIGNLQLKALHTPGHTAGSMCYVLELDGQTHVFTGDTLLIGGCGRTDFQSGSSRDLYASVTQKLFTLPDNTQIWPGHDYKGLTRSSIAQEKKHNVRFFEQGQLRSMAEFEALMAGLSLPMPKRIQEAVPANLKLGARHDAHPDQTRTSHITQVQGYAGDIYPELAWQWLQQQQAVLVDVRTEAERAWVGFVPDSIAVPLKDWPGMAVNPNFDASIHAAALPGKKLLMLCRSGVRSIAAAKQATALGYEAYNILEGFEGDPDAQAHRGNVGGWRLRGLPWRQN